jgi:hypothetical protein
MQKMTTETWRNIREYFCGPNGEFRRDFLKETALAGTCTLRYLQARLQEEHGITTNAERATRYVVDGIEMNWLLEVGDACVRLDLLESQVERNERTFAELKRLGRA